ncbi:hypothetical protein GGF46_000668 [Coemansia sp. RSA 552]|nr:hypothetical protein GGF46_000668 [Coemansia sp. RSA 552]
MSAKRALDALSEAEGPEFADTHPYSTYQEAHEALLELRGVCGEDKVAETARRALRTVRTVDLPGMVQQMGVRLATLACAHPVTNSAHVISVLVGALESGDPSIRCEVYQALAAIHELKNGPDVPEPTRQLLDRAVQRDLNHSQHHLRCASLALLPVIRAGVEDAWTFDVICRFTTDSHPKVRQMALCALQRQHMMGTVLPVEMYDECVVATKDDFEQVRLVALELVWAVSSAHPEYPVVINKFRVTENIRLLDDAFVKICDMVNDSSMVVRQRACTLLGRFRNVDHKFLSQTFSKQVMSHLRRFVPRHGMRGRNQGVHKSRGPAIPMPKGDVDVESDEFKLLDSGAAGAFVHGLEDEYQEVRDAAIESITELTIASAEFSAKAVDFLVDMFNDSSDRVRQCAIRALVAIGTRSLIKLTEEQLSIALSAMKDASSTVRKGIYEFLTVSQLDKSEWLENLMVAGFRGNLEKYPEDQLEIYRAIRPLGLNHSSIINAALVRTLLNISDNYLSREARIDDIVYAGNVILVMNTRRSVRQNLAAVLPDYIFTHLPYLRDKYPGCFPPDIIESVPEKLAFVRHMLQRPRTSSSIAEMSLEDNEKRVSDAFSRLTAALGHLCSREEHAIDGAGEGQISRAVKEFALLHDGPACSLVARRQTVVMHYAEVSLMVLRAQSDAGSPSQHAVLVDAAARIMYKSYEVEARTIGLDPLCRLALVYLRLFAHAIWIRTHSLLQHDIRLINRIRGELQERASRVAQAMGARSLKVPELGRLVKELEELAADVDMVKVDLCRKLGEILSLFVAEFRPLAFVPAGHCQHAEASVQSIASVARRTTKFNHLFPLHLSLSSSLDWVVHQADVFVAVRLPSQQTVYLPPPPGALRPKQRMHWALEWSKIPVSLPLGSGENTAVELSIALRHTTDSPWSDSFILDGRPVPQAYKAEEYFKSMGSAELQRYIQVSPEPCTISVDPIEFRPQASVHIQG